MERLVTLLPIVVGPVLLVALLWRLIRRVNELDLLISRVDELEAKVRKLSAILDPYEKPD